MTWVVYGINFRNNIVGDMKGGWCGVLCVLNDTDTRTASQMVSMDGDVYQRTSATSPSVLMKWATATKGAETNYSSLSSFKTAIANQEVKGADVLGTMPSILPAAGVALPSNIATILGLATGATYVGPRR